MFLVQCTQNYIPIQKFMVQDREKKTLEMNEGGTKHRHTYIRREKMTYKPYGMIHKNESFIESK